MPACDCNDDWYFRETSFRPCSCRSTCHRSTAYEVTRTVSRPAHRLRTPCSCTSRVPSHAYEHHWGCCTDPGLCMCYECRKVLGRSEAGVRKRRNRFCEHSSKVLERWFSKFDRDRDGYLNLEDLEYLMDHLGVRCHTEKLLRVCDRDCDGRLSFEEFVRMWRRAGTHDQELIRLTGCCDMPGVVKKYDLYLDTECPQCLDRSSSRITISTEHPVHSVKCKCGLAEKIIPFVKHEHKTAVAARRKKSRTESEADPDKYPVMSHNRDRIV